MHFVTTVCLSCSWSKGLKTLTWKLYFWGSSSEYLGQVRVSRSLAKGEGRRSKRRVCVSCLDSLTSERFNIQTSLSVEHLGQGQVSRLRGQGQGHTSITKHTHLQVVCLLLKGNLVYIFIRQVALHDTAM